MALAISNKKFTRFQYNRDGITIKSDLFHGFASDGQEIEIVFKHGTNEIISIYPIFTR